MSFPRYPEYKESGATWLGDVPSHWMVKRTGYFFEDRREKVSDKDFEPLSVTKNGVVPQLDTAAKTDDGDNRKKVCRGDFVINSRSDRKGSAGAANIDGSVSLINTVMRPRADVEISFAHHLLRSQPFQEEYYRFGKGIVADLWSTNYSELRNISLALPPRSEQACIANFLDFETAKIDALVAEQEKLMALLKEKRQAVISHAVTKGLDPAVPMKDSGVEWLGDVPAHWDLKRIKSLSQFTTSGPRGWSERISEDGSIFVQSGDLSESLGIDFASAKRINVADDAEAARTLLLDGDVVVCITGAKTGNVAVCTTVSEPAYVNQHLCLIRPNAEIMPVFMGVTLKGAVGQTQFELSQYGLKQGLSLENVRETLIPRPPLAEQARIVSFLQLEAAKHDALRLEAERTIMLLKERRTALISEAVTGKIDVRGVAKALAA